MRDSGLDLFDPRIAADENLSPGGSRDPDFGFAFNDSNFSDRILRIEIAADPSEVPSESQACQTLADWAARKNKRRRGDAAKREIALDINPGPEEQILDIQSDAEDGVGGENYDEEEMLIIEDLHSGDEAANSDDSIWSEVGSKILRVKTLHISSPILAAKSPFFYKLFSNGMLESELRHVTLRINASEEAALMELLSFMYTNTLKADTATLLLDLLLCADKFEVSSCMRHCSRRLRNLPMTPESALLYLDLPSSVLMAEAVQSLTDAAKHFLAFRYKDISKYHDEVMNLPLAGIEALLSSDHLQVPSEDAVYDIALKWARTHHPDLNERRAILCTHLGRYIRFPFLTTRKLRKVLACNEFDSDFAKKSVLDALFFKVEASHRQRAYVPDESSSSSSMCHTFVERAYKYRPVKVIEFNSPCQQCVVYLDLKKEECGALYPSGRVYSQAFHLGGQGFFLSAHCNMDQQSSFNCFGLFLGMQEKGSVTFAVDYEFAARSKPQEEYTSKYKGNYVFTGGKAVGYRNLFSIPWVSFMADDSPYFINGMLHLRAELTIKREAAA